MVRIRSAGARATPTPSASREASTPSVRLPAPTPPAGEPAQFATRHRALVALVGAVGEVQGPGMGVQPGQREVLADTGPAEELDAPVDHPRGHLGDRHLARRDLDAGALDADGVDEPGRLEDHETRLLDADPRLSDPILDDSLFREGLAERGPL